MLPISLRKQDFQKSREQLIEELDELRSQLNEWANIPLSDDAMAGIGMDLREHQQTRKALMKSERKFREMIEALPIAVYTTDAEGRITHYNPAAVELAGRIPEPGASFWCVSWKLFHPDGRPMPHDTCPMAVAIKKGRAIRNVEAIVERPDGTRRWIQPYPTLLHDNKGDVVGGINVLVDITERKEAEEALRESEQKFRALFDNSVDAVLLTRRDDTIEGANTSACAMWGLSEQEFCQAGRSGIFDVKDPHFIAAFERQHENGRVQAVELTAIHKSGKRFPVELDSAILSGNPERSFVILRDISERKQNKEALLRMNENLERQVAQRTVELERRNREIRELAHITIGAMENDRKALSKELHDSIGGTLAAIKYQLESRVEDIGPPPDSIKLPLEKIINYLGDAIRESRRITKQLRPSVLDDFGLVAAMDEHIGDFQKFHPQIKVLKRIRIYENEISDDAKTVLYRVLQEALNNVGKHSKADQVEVRCFRHKGCVKLKIKDDGVGFNAGEFIQSMNVMEGYGLHSMKERIEICKGKFHLASATGKGTKITASIPIIPDGNAGCI